MNRVKYALITASIGFALVFTLSCSSDDKKDDGEGGNNASGNSVSFNENSQIYNGDGTPYTGDGVIRMWEKNIECQGGSGYECGVYFNAGSIDKGIVNLNLPTITADDMLTTLNCPSSPNGTKFYNARFTLTNGNKDEGFRIISGYGQIEERIYHWYFSEAVNITCSYKEDDSYSEILNIDAKAGWNKVYEQTDKATRTHKLSTNNILTKEVKWTIEIKD